MTERRTLVTGALVYDAESGTIAPRDVYIDGSTVVHRFDRATADEVVDATGLLVTPGWVDLHTHVFAGQDLGVDPARLGPRTGVTTMIDAGSAGAHLYDAFATSLAGVTAPRVRAFLNISSIGTTSILLAGELQHPAYADERACIRAIRRHPEILGVKVRASANVGGDNTFEALRRARRVANEVGLPLMVHVGPPPVGYDDVLALLRSGDIVTHCFSGHTDRTIADPDDDDRLWPAAQEARDRGVVFDVGHGGGSFDARRAGAAIRAGFLPDTISSDVHAYAELSAGGDVAGPTPAAGRARPVTDSLVAEGLPLVADKMLALGLGLEDTLARVTAAPAAAGGLATTGIGSLRPGAPADVAVFRVVTGLATFRDTLGTEFTGDRRLRPVLTIQSGSVVFHAENR